MVTVTQTILIIFFNCNLLLHCSQIMSEVSLTLGSSLPQFTLSFSSVPVRVCPRAMRAYMCEREK